MSELCETTEFSPAIDTIYNWKIEDFPQFLQFDWKDGLDSSEFNIMASNNKQLQLKLVLSSDVGTGYDVRNLATRLRKNGVIEKSGKDFVLVKVKVDAIAKPTELKLVGTLELVTDDGTTFLGQLGVCDYYSSYWSINNNSSVVEYFRYDWTNPRNAFCVPRASRSLQIKVKLTTRGKLSSTTAIVPSTIKANDSSVKLQSDIRALLTNANDSADFRIVCEDQIFPCHEAILRARSPVLDRMFQQKMKESISRKLIINDLKKDTTSILLEYLYTGEVPGKVENLAELIYTADKYHIVNLLELCYDKIPEDDEKIVDILLIANRHNLVDLSKVVLRRFVSSNLPKVDVKILDILIIAEKHKLEDFKKAILQKILMKKDSYMKNGDFMNKLKKNPSILMDFFKLCKCIH